MSREAVGRAIEAMQDESLRAEVVGGDLARLPTAGDLDDRERAMVIAAAADYPEVAGFSFSWGLPAANPTFDSQDSSTPFNQAVGYSYGRILDHNPVL